MKIENLKADDIHLITYALRKFYNECVFSNLRDDAKKLIELIEAENKKQVNQLTNLQAERAAKSIQSDIDQLIYKFSSLNLIGIEPVIEQLNEAISEAVDLEIRYTDIVNQRGE